MLIVNGKKFAKTKKEFTDSVFDAGSSCIGFWKKVGGGILLMDMHKNPRVFIVNNSTSDRFFTTAARSKVNGKIFYMFGLSSSDSAFLGLDQVTLSNRYELAVQALEQVYGK